MTDKEWLRQQIESLPNNEERLRSLWDMLQSAGGLVTPGLTTIEVDYSHIMNIRDLILEIDPSFPEKKRKELDASHPPRTPDPAPQ